MKFNQILLFLLLFFFCGCYPFSSKDPQGAKEIKEGDVFFASGDVDKAILLWKKSLEKEKSALGYEKMIMAYIIKNDLSLADKWIQEGLFYFPDNTNLLFNNSLVRYYNKEYETAMENCDKVLSANQFYPNVHFLKGMIYEETGREKEAKEEFVKELNVNPGSKNAWLKIREEVKNEE
ncbi:hypothetical protein M0P98_01145 [bacterium]|nr:hypothetical protein [bacterium]